MSESTVPLAAMKRPLWPIRAADMPALLSEGPEPEPSRPGRASWPPVFAITLRLLTRLRGEYRR